MIMSKKYWISLLALSLCVLVVKGQNYDLLIKNGHLIDPKNNIDGTMDLAVKDGKIARVAANIPAAQAELVVDADGLYVTPGLIDMHTHNFHGTKPNSNYSDGWNSLAPDGYTFRAGVTTVVDVGGAGWRNFETFKRQTIDPSKTRVLAFLNIVGSGMKGNPIEQNLADMDAKLTAMKAKQYPGLVVGVKLAHYTGPEWTPVDRLVEAGTLADIPVMVDFGGHEPELSMETLLLEKFRPGDILTHCYAHVDGRIPVVDEKGKLMPFALTAQKRGIIFDVGHGGGSFRFDQAVPAIKQGLKPNSISTDLHIGSMNAGMKDMLNVMSKFLNMGISLSEAVTMSTWNPAQYIKRTDLGHLTVGEVADITVLDLLEGDFGFVDVTKKKLTGNQKLECELTIREGQIVWDLNGLSSPMWDE